MKKLLLFALVFVCTASAFAQNRHGVILGVSNGWFDCTALPGIVAGSGYEPDLRKGKLESRPSFNIGYQFQFDIKDTYAIDAALLYQSRGVHVNFRPSSDRIVDETKRFNAISLHGVFNYKVWNGIKVGAGIEPTRYWKKDYWTNKTLTSYDYPIVLKAGYDLKFMELSLRYKHGLKPVIEGVGYVLNAKTRDLEISIFVPLGKFGF